MKQPIRYLLSSALLLMGVEAFALNGSQLDQNTINAIKLEELTRKRAALVRQIEIEDAKRGREIADSTYLYVEMINDKQDSLCLELRSQLVTIDLEIEEIRPQRTPLDVIINQFNNLQETK